MSVTDVNYTGEGSRPENRGHLAKGIRGMGILLLLLANDQSGADVPDMQAEDHLPPRRPQAGRSGRMHWPLRSGMKS